jgi:hypothetical protein
MKRTKPGGHIAVRRGEPFVVHWVDHALSGFDMTVSVPESIERVSTERQEPKGMGGEGKVIEHFRCRKPGRYEIIFREGRPWEDDKSQLPVRVDCR